MTDTIEQRLQDAAEAAHRSGATLDREALLARIEGRRPASRGWTLALAGAATAAAVIGGVAVFGPELGSPTVDPIATPTGAPSATPTPDDTPTAGPTPSPTGELGLSEEPHASGDCSAAGMDPTLADQPELPVPVAELRQRLAELAVACDYDGLAVLGGDDLSFSFGGSDNVAYWQELEAQATEPGDLGPMEALRLVLETPPGRMEAESAGPSVYWAWPRLHLMVPDDTDQAELEAAIDELVAVGLYTRDELETMLSWGNGYLGWRVMIELPEGADEAIWTAFIAGD